MTGGLSSWFTQKEDAGDTGTDNCHFSTMHSTKCTTEMGEDGVPQRRCERISRRLRHCPGKAPEEVESTTEHTVEALPKGEQGSSSFFSSSGSSSSHSWSGTPSDLMPFGRSLGGLFGFGGEPSSKDQPAAPDAFPPFDAIPFGGLMGGMLGSSLSELIDGIQKFDDMSRAFEEGFQQSMQQGEERRGGQWEGFFAPPREGSAHEGTTSPDFFGTRRFRRAAPPAADKFEDHKKDFQEV
mmetsp:Transcript_20106/g.44007  ORF Transcript_20106/g.44007 Transcript_20106/m.44007 type:complete len:239 (-) Transcript_20106:1315-2031(-)|eukprot:CAMPEP_0118927406 /NCGR_PEP_ID=MMETSP1169-20130426/4881_1 /TAXON_ID=36882 /ORGANISM="Pyramimonas obovata, Strain CCMP722" /LENGTH=238 /DNA_ID=CAMNT_0006869153 /DNA_START=94 /DNA_END=810 /DNA_ORIENTATION=-